MGQQTFILAQDGRGAKIEMVYGEFEGLHTGKTFDRITDPGGTRTWTCIKVFSPEAVRQFNAIASLMGGTYKFVEMFNSAK